MVTIALVVGIMLWLTLLLFIGSHLPEEPANWLIAWSIALFWGGLLLGYMVGAS